MAKVSQRQVLGSLIKPTGSALPSWTGFLFAQISGGEITANVEKIYEGGKLRPTIICAPSEVGDITLTAHYDADTLLETTSNVTTAVGIEAKINVLRPLVGRAIYDISVQSYDCDLNAPVANTGRLYKGALLVGITEPDGDSSSGAPATFAMTFAVSDVIRG